MSTFELKTMTVRPPTLEFIADVDGERIYDTMKLDGAESVRDTYLMWAMDTLERVAAEHGDPEWRERDDGRDMSFPPPPRS